MGKKAPAATVAPREGVEDLHVRTAERFLDALRPGHSRWTDPTLWVHRGQANAAWELKARGVRDSGEFQRHSIGGAIKGWPDRKEILDRMLARFARGLDESGMVIPARSPRVTWTSELSSNALPANEAWPLMALAQHHGLPTILLDWTRRAAVAAYIAAAEASDPNPAVQARIGTHLAVWSLSLGDKSFDASRRIMWWKKGELVLYEAPGGTNPNLRAQSGLFLIPWGEDDPSIEQIVVRHRDEGRTTPLLRRTTLPKSEAPRLLRLLAHEGIHGATMFPGADGVVRAMREEATWDTARVVTKGAKSP